MERRRSMRFDLTLPALVFVNTGAGGKQRTLELKTRNLSAAGAFFLTPAPPDEASWLEVALMIQTDALPMVAGDGGGLRSCVRLRGHVVRRSPDGFAATFGRQTRIFPLEDLLERLQRELIWIRRNQSGDLAQRLVRVT